MKNVFSLLIAILSLNFASISQETGEQQPRSGPKDQTFTFKGGTMRQFVDEFKSQLGMDLHDTATIDRKALNLRIPKMKIPVGEKAWETVLITYNNLSNSAEDNIGRWVIARDVVRGGDPTPNAIVFMPPKNLSESVGLKVRAFSMDKLKPEDLGMLVELVEVEAADLRKTAEDSGYVTNFSGQLRYHKGTGLLIASGGPEYVELASTVVEAFKETL